METVHITQSESPVGVFRVASTGKGLAFVELPHASGCGLRGWLERFARDAQRREDYASNRPAIRQIVEYLEGKRTRFDLPLDLRGTAFQLAVWEALLEIPYGETRSYREIARRVGRPGAVRAVGTANGSNPVSLVVPCHRVIRADGALGGYGGGTGLKRRLLAMESSRPADDRLL